MKCVEHLLSNRVGKFAKFCFSFESVFVIFKQNPSIIQKLSSEPCFVYIQVNVCGFNLIKSVVFDT